MNERYNGHFKKVKWKTPEDFRAMETKTLLEYLAEYQEIKRLGVLIKQGGRPLTDPEHRHLGFYIAVIEGILKYREGQPEPEGQAEDGA